MRGNNQRCAVRRCRRDDARLRVQGHAVCHRARREDVVRHRHRLLNRHRRRRQRRAQLRTQNCHGVEHADGAYGCDAVESHRVVSDRAAKREFLADIDVPEIILLFVNRDKAHPGRSERLPRGSVRAKIILFPEVAVENGDDIRSRRAARNCRVHRLVKMNGGKVVWSVSHRRRSRHTDQI